jgi:hypothetical protein
VDAVAPAVGAGSASFTLGSGIDYAFTRNWILGFESNYCRFESHAYEIGGGAGLHTFNLLPRDVFTYVGRLTWKVD